jgi:hypothetical protein
MLDETEFREHVRMVVYDPIEPYVLWLARLLVKAFL